MTLSLVAGLTSLAACSLINKPDEAVQCSTDTECTSRGGEFANTYCGTEKVCLTLTGSGGGGQGGNAGSSQAGSAGASGCTTNDECTGAATSGLGICRAGQCVRVTNDVCPRTIGDPVINSKRTIGMMVPLGSRFQTEGNSFFEAVRTAHQEYTNASQSDQYQAPLIVVCDEGGDVEAGIKHLTETVGVKVIIGPSWNLTSSKATPLVKSAGAISMLPLNDSPTLTTSSSQNLIWGCRPNRSSVATYWKKAIAEFEKLLKARTSPTPPATLNVALVVANDSSSTQLGGVVAPLTDFNGTTFSENQTAGRFFQVNYPDFRDNVSISYGDYASQVINPSGSQVPNTIIIISSGDGASQLVPQIEQLWPTGGGAPDRPNYLFIGDSGNIPTLLTVDHTSNTLASRLYTLDIARSAQNDLNLASYRTAYAAINQNHTPKPNAEFFYDCFWSMIYALDASVTRTNLSIDSLDGATFASKGIGALQSKDGTQVNVGFNGAATMFGLLNAQAKIDLVGVSSELDYDLTTGVVTANGALGCVKDFKVVPSGIEFDGQGNVTNKGTNQCL